MALRAWRHLLIADQTAVEAICRRPKPTCCGFLCTLAPSRYCPSRGPAFTRTRRERSAPTGQGCRVGVRSPKRSTQPRRATTERAWSCGSDLLLDQHCKPSRCMGYGGGAHWLGATSAVLSPGQGCPNRPASLARPRFPVDPPLSLHAFDQGRVGLQRHRILGPQPWSCSLGSIRRLTTQPQPPLSLAVASLPPQKGFQQNSAAQLSCCRRTSALCIDGPVLAVAELSGEMFFHWQLELLPRLGRVVAFALKPGPPCASGTTAEVRLRPR